LRLFTVEGWPSDLVVELGKLSNRSTIKRNLRNFSEGGQLAAQLSRSVQLKAGILNAQTPLPRPL
jgi:hypothetical protein